MYINELYDKLDLLSEERFQFIGRDGMVLEQTEPVLTEHLMDVYINGQLTMKLICIPQHLAELVLGRLLTEGMIISTDEVERIDICAYGSQAKVILRSSPEDRKTDYVETTPSCCTGNHLLDDHFAIHKDIRPIRPIVWQTDWIFALADRFADGMPLHQSTFATHSCFLSRNGCLLFACEDIGRHNALDKVIGFALRHDIDLCECIVYTSGRVPTDMALKAIRAGIPVLASKASPSAEAVFLAREYGLTLICAARRDRMKRFT